MPARLRPILVTLGLLLSSVPELEAAHNLLFSEHPIASSGMYFPEYVFAADMDNDNDLDVLATSLGLPNRLVWFENTGGSDRFGSQQVIDAPWEYAPSVVRADLNNDDEPDMLSIEYADGTIAWYANEGGTLGARQEIGPVAAGYWSLFAEDLDNDGDLDVLAASIDDGTIVWYANTDGQGSFEFRQTINTAADGSWSVFVLDLDNDGDPDVLAAGYADGSIAWHANTDGKGAFGPRQVIYSAEDGAASEFQVDLDNDGDLDVLAASTASDSGQGTIFWQENTDGLGALGRQQVIATSLYGACSVFAADLDNDGDMDVLSAALMENKIAWYENLYSRPVAKAGDDRTVQEGVKVTLDGSGSSDTSGAIPWSWVQTDGPDVTLRSPNTARPYFNAPQVDAAGAKLTFTLTITNSQGITASDSLDVTVTNQPKAPVAKAGDDRTVAGGTAVSLDGSASEAGEGSITAWAWAQSAGTPVTLIDADKATASFTAPEVGGADETLSFTLTVTNSAGLSSSDSLTITLQDSAGGDDSGGSGDDTGGGETGGSSNVDSVGSGSSSGGGGGCALSPSAGLGLDWLLLLAPAVLARLRRPRRAS
ncbi:FG-GAP repeat domain-containing protein [Desulfocurvibacter africanus]|uniref:PKD domain containing protein n=1 Tax=Desulfocurvibacter africanus subsp. africanus str. Walvis Bay TaxID=690850 RepID=F3YXK7_DESAF|nr:VCBS repeat-containing protein [Desulfocurvibacter africanus]EGJ51784.1 PKD domain containing protein [Desulfocurvibacter africanus subsp. africanus str. Walvis Bay]